MAGRRKYDWDTWFDRPVTILRRGVHYQCPQSTMANSIRNAASRMGLSVSVEDRGDSIVMKVPSAIPHTAKITVAGKPDASALAQVD
jgi:hypothetical protein